MNKNISVRAWQFTTIVMTGSVLAALGLYRLFGGDIPGARTDFSPSNLLWFLFEVLPLLLIIPGIISNHARTIFCATLISMLYFIEGIYFAAVPQTRSFGVSETVFALGMFIASTYLLRGVNEFGRGS